MDNSISPNLANFRILQLNCQNAYATMIDLGKTMCDGDFAVAALQEPHVKYGRVCGVPRGWRLFRDIDGDAAIVVRSVDIDCSVVSKTRHGICMRLQGPFGVVLVASIYCRHGSLIEPYIEYMDSVLVSAGGSPLIMCMDANALSPMWFSKMRGGTSEYRGRMRGQLLGEWIASVDVGVLNEPSDLYTFDGPMGVSDIDVTVANSAALAAFDFRWTVRGSSTSDHNLIEIVASSNRVLVRETEPLRRWRLHEVDWGFYSDNIRAAASEQPLDDFRALSLDDQVSTLDRWMCSVNDSLFRRSARAGPRRIRWWTRELDMMRRNYRRLRKHFQRGLRSNADDLARRRADVSASLRTYKDALIRVKEDDWRSFVRDNRNDPWGAVYRICRGRGRHADIEALCVGNDTLTSWSACMGTLLGTFFPEAERIDRPPIGEVIAPPILERAEISGSVGRVRGRRSPGIDGMTGEMCKSIWKAIPEYLEAIFAECIGRGYFPDAWKIARVVVLLKSPDKVRSNPRSYRGISLLPVLGKVLERIMVTRLLEDSNERTSEYQFGFREGRSVEDAWLHLRRCVRDSASKYVLGIFVDFKGAFDYLSWGGVLDRLRQVGCRELSLWESYFSNRRACVVGASGTVWRSVTRGCPQGSICGPYIWNLMMDTLLAALGRSFKLCAYADDLLIVVEGQTRADLESCGGQAMRIVSEWSANVGVEVALDKTVMMLLKGKLSLSRPPLVRSGGASIRYVTQVKYLGLVVGERMNFLPHLTHVRDKLTTVASMVRRILRSDWGLSRRAVRVIYGGLFVACAAYGAPIWYETVMSVCGRNKVLACQRVMLLACMPVCRTVSTDALQVLMGAAPLDLEVIRLAVAFKIRKGLPLLPMDWVSASDLAIGDAAANKALLIRCVMDRWQERWTASDKGRVTYSFIRDVTFVSQHPDFGFGMSLGFLLTGHGSISTFLFLRGLSDSPNCGCGSGQETVAHILTECHNYDDIRDLAGMGVYLDGDRWVFDEVLMDSRTFANLGAFARLVFGRRRAD